MHDADLSISEDDDVAENELAGRNVPYPQQVVLAQSWRHAGALEAQPLFAARLHEGVVQLQRRRSQGVGGGHAASAVARSIPSASNARNSPSMSAANVSVATSYSPANRARSWASVSSRIRAVQISPATS